MAHPHSTADLVATGLMCAIIAVAILIDFVATTLDWLRARSNSKVARRCKPPCHIGCRTCDHIPEDSRWPL